MKFKQLNIYSSRFLNKSVWKLMDLCKSRWASLPSRSLPKFLKSVLAVDARGLNWIQRAILYPSAVYMIWYCCKILRFREQVYLGRSQQARLIQLSMHIHKTTKWICSFCVALNSAWNVHEIYSKKVEMSFQALRCVISANKVHFLYPYKWLQWFWHILQYMPTKEKFLHFFCIFKLVLSEFFSD